MIAKGLLLLCVVAYTQAFYGGFVPIPIKHKVIPIVKTIREPVYIEKRVRVPHYIERAIPVPFAMGGGAGGAGVGGVAAAGGVGSFGLNAQIEDADTVNIQADVSGLGAVGGAVGGFSDNNNFDNGFDNNNFGGFIGGSRGLRGQGQRIRVQQTQVAQPSARISQPIIGGHGHGIQKKPHFGGHF